MTDGPFIVKNGLVVNNALFFSNNTLSVPTISANVITANVISFTNQTIANTLTIGNSTSNVVISSTALNFGIVTVNTSQVFAGNATLNAVLSQSGLSVQNSSASAQVNPGIITVPQVTTANGTTSLSLTTGNNSGGYIVVNASGVIELWGNSTVKVANVDSGGFVTLKSKVQTVAYSANIQWDLANGNIGVLTLTANTVFPAPLHMSPGNYILHVYNDSGGNRHITSWNSVFKWIAGVAPTVTTTANAHDIYSFTCDGTNMYGSFLPNLQ